VILLPNQLGQILTSEVQTFERPHKTRNYKDDFNTIEMMENRLDWKPNFCQLSKHTVNFLDAMVYLSKHQCGAFFNKDWLGNNSKPLK
jgi:hypothetical protein